MGPGSACGISHSYFVSFAQGPLDCSRLLGPSTLSRYRAAAASIITASKRNGMTIEPSLLTYAQATFRESQDVLERWFNSSSVTFTSVLATQNEFLAQWKLNC